MSEVGEKMQSVDIFDFDGYSDFLRQYCAARRETFSNFSVRWLAKRADIKSPTLLRMICKGERRATLDTVEKLSRAMNLTATESKFAVYIAELELNRSRHITELVKGEVKRLRQARRGGGEGDT